MRVLSAAAGMFLMLLSAGAAVRAEDATPPASNPPAGESAPAMLEAPKPTWDQAENFRAAAEHLGKLQRTRGAKGAYDYIAACYKTHGLAEAYGAAFEACIAQDYMQTQVLAQIYSRMSPDQLQKLGSPSPQQLADAMGKRLVAAFSQYKIPVSYVKDFKVLVDKHGFPVFLSVVFPNAKIPTSPAPSGKDGLPQQDSRPEDKP